MVKELVKWWVRNNSHCARQPYVTPTEIRQRLNFQIIHHKAKELWVLFNRWGRVGDSGQHQRTPYNDPSKATAEFKKIFKSKTGNEWDNKDK